MTQVESAVPPVQSLLPPHNDSEAATALKANARAGDKLEGPKGTPLVTIYIPTCNRPELLARALNSCLCQSMPDFEVIVVDDCSESEISAQNEALCRQDARIRYFRLDLRSGACVARNLAIQYARGLYITGLDDDDEFADVRLAHFLSYRQDLERYSFLSTGYKVISNGGLFSYGKSQREISLNDLLFANHVGNQIFTYTSRLQDIGGFDAEFKSCQDYDCWIRLAQRFGSGIRLAQVSYYLYHNHDTKRISTSSWREQGYRKIIEKHGAAMSNEQLNSQDFYLMLNTQKWTPWQLLAKSGRTTLLVAMKNIFMHFIARMGVINKWIVL